MKIGSITITDTKFRMPCVYEFLRNSAVLYVGFSSLGFLGVFRDYGKGSQRNRKSAFEQAEQIRITVFDDGLEARAEERRLIELHKPIGNIRLPSQFDLGPMPLLQANKKQMRLEQRRIQEKTWIEAGQNSFKPGAVSLTQFLADTPKYTALWYRMKAAFNEGRRLRLEQLEQSDPMPTHLRTRTRVLD
jgi:hypothetical protein